MTTAEQENKKTVNLKVDFEYCYGIKKLNYEFKFSESHKTYSIYGQNGSMKTSFAKIFENIANDEAPKDAIFPNRESKATVTFGAEPIKNEEILVINSYKEKYESNKVSTLLVNKKLQQKFNDVHGSIDDLKNSLLAALKNISKLKNIAEIEKEISKTFYDNDENNFLRALDRIKNEINDEDVVKYDGIKYKDIFDDKVIAFLKDSEVQKDVKEYMEKYEEILDKSTYFKTGIFNHSQAEDTATNLDKNGFFKAEHSVLFGGKTIKNKEELTRVIEDEKNKILDDVSLQLIFKKLDTKITKNQSLKIFRDFLSLNKFIIPDLSNLGGLKARLWKYYIHSEKDAFNKLMTEYSEGKTKIKDITNQAERERTDWLDVIEIYNERFLVPFRLSIANKTDVLLKNSLPAVSFEFIDGDEKQEVAQDKLMEVLSQGEKRALYLLNIIFEIQGRKKTGGTHLLIIDDIADSFDYKNKYAIIEYLRDMSKTDGFYQILLSHNFDFHRTVSSRLYIERENRLVVSKSNDGLKLEKEIYQNNPFTHWRKNLNKDRFLVAAIPFVRNLAQYSGNKDVENDLTEFLHVKQNSEKLTVGCLKTIFGGILKADDVDKISGVERSYSELLNSALAEKSVENLESKIVKSIAIRLIAEIFVIKEISDDEYVSRIKKHQTRELIEKYIEKFPNEMENQKILDKVQLMTPESIHVNSFMYEPLLDMSNEYLDGLHKKVLGLQISNDGSEK